MPENELSKQEKETVDKVILDLRMILCKTGYGKIIIHCDKRNGKQVVEVGGQLYTKKVIEF